MMIQKFNWPSTRLHKSRRQIDMVTVLWYFFVFILCVVLCYERACCARKISWRRTCENPLKTRSSNFHFTRSYLCRRTTPPSSQGSIYNDDVTARMVRLHDGNRSGVSLRTKIFCVYRKGIARPSSYSFEIENSPEVSICESHWKLESWNWRFGNFRGKLPRGPSQTFQLSVGPASAFQKEKIRSILEL